MNMFTDLKKEADVFSAYLISDLTPDPVKARYVATTQFLEPDLLSSVAIRAPWLLGFMDAGTALVRREHPLRKKLLVMTAILEADKTHAAHFLASGPASISKYLRFISICLRAGAKAAVGIPLVIALGLMEKHS